MADSKNIYDTIGHLQEDGAKGSNQMCLGQYNERLVLSLVRESKGVTKADLARMTLLTPQTVSVIVNRLLGGNYLKKGLPENKTTRAMTVRVVNSCNNWGKKNNYIQDFQKLQILHQ